MNEGARQANNENRHREERLHGERVEALLTEIRDLLKLFVWREAATAMDRMDADAEQPTMAIRECDVCGESVVTEGVGNFLVRLRHEACGGSAEPPSQFPARLENLSDLDTVRGLVLLAHSYIQDSMELPVRVWELTEERLRLAQETLMQAATLMGIVRNTKAAGAVREAAMGDQAHQQALTQQAQSAALAPSPNGEGA